MHPYLPTHSVPSTHPYLPTPYLARTPTHTVPTSYLPCAPTLPRCTRTHPYPHRTFPRPLLRLPTRVHAARAYAGRCTNYPPLTAYLQVYMLLELALGGELFSLLQKKAPLPDKEAMFYVSQVVAIFAFMYSQKARPAATCSE